MSHSEGLLSLQMRRQQEELARWRALEDAQRGGGRPTAARQLPESATRRRPPAAPRKEVAELQAWVMERRELMSRQRQQRTEAGARTRALARDGRARHVPRAAEAADLERRLREALFHSGQADTASQLVDRRAVVGYESICRIDPRDLHREPEIYASVAAKNH